MRSEFWRKVIKYAAIAIEVISNILKGLGKDKDPKQLNK